MVALKTSEELRLMKKAGQITAEALLKGGQAVRPGATTAEICRVIHEVFIRRGAQPSFLNYGGFPASACISVNEEVIHGIPSSDRTLCEGDIVSIDVGAKIDGFHGDSAATFACGKISEKAQALLDATRLSLERAIAAAVRGNRVGDISAAVQQTVEPLGFSVVRDFVGHGVGRNLHEAPEVPNFGRPGHGMRLLPGMTLAIEPMVNAGGWEVRVLPDRWTVVTKDGGLSAHFEHTVAITPDGAAVLTKL
jgi:methionyl aminopeptidase